VAASSGSWPLLDRLNRLYNHPEGAPKSFPKCCNTITQMGQVLQYINYIIILKH
jgi:hypothetical protein